MQEIQLDAKSMNDLLNDSEIILRACYSLPETNTKISHFEEKKTLQENLLKAYENKSSKIKENEDYLLDVEYCKIEIEIFEIKNLLNILENTIHNLNQRKAELEGEIEKCADLATELTPSVLADCVAISKSIGDIRALSIYEPLLNSEQYKEYEIHELVSVFLNCIIYKSKNGISEKTKLKIAGK